MSAEDDSSDKRQAPSGGGEVRLATLIFFSHTSLYLGHLLEGIIQPKGRFFPSVNPPWAYLQGHIRRSVTRRFQILSSWHHSVIGDSLEKIIISALVPTTYCATSQKKKNSEWSQWSQMLSSWMSTGQWQKEQKQEGSRSRQRADT